MAGNFKRKVRLVFTALLGVIVGVLITAYILAGEIYEYQDSYDGVTLPNVDAIVCLAGGRGRILTAADLWVAYFNHSPQKTPYLYFSGVGPQTTWPTLSNHLKSAVKDHIPLEQVILEKASTNTLENAEILIEQVKARGWRRVLLLTSSYHMKRSQFILNTILKKQGISLQVETATHFQEPFESREWRSSPIGIQVTLTEYLKFLYYRWTLG